MGRVLTFQQYYNMRGEEFQVGDMVGVRVVAWVGYCNTWAAYSGPAGWTDRQIAMSGDKIRYEAARGLFPTLDAAFAWRP